MTPKSLILALAFMVWTAAWATPEKVNSIQVKLSGLKSREGKAYIFVHHTPESFVTKKRLFRGAVLDLETQDSQFEFENIPDGEYAVFVYHDENGDGRLNTSLIGVPKEGVGFSNDAIGPQESKPSFADAKFKVRGGERKIMVIRLRYRKG